MHPEYPKCCNSVVLYLNPILITPNTDPGFRLKFSIRDIEPIRLKVRNMTMKSEIPV